MSENNTQKSGSQRETLHQTACENSEDRSMTPLDECRRDPARRDYRSRRFPGPARPRCQGRSLIPFAFMFPSAVNATANLTVAVVLTHRNRRQTRADLGLAILTGPVTLTVLPPAKTSSP